MDSADVGMTSGGVVKLLFESYNFHDWRIVIFGAGHVAQALVHACCSWNAASFALIGAEWLAKLPQSSKLHTIQLAEPRIRRRATARRFRALYDDGSQNRSSDYAGNLQRRFEQAAYLGVIGSQAEQSAAARTTR